MNSSISLSITAPPNILQYHLRHQFEHLSALAKCFQILDRFIRFYYLFKQLAALAADRKVCGGITKEEVLQKLEECVAEKDNDSVRLMNNLNTLILALRVNVNALAKYTNYDASSICRIRTGKRSPSNPAEFARAVSAYVVRRYTSAADRAMLHNLLGCAPEEPDLEAMITAFLLGKESSGVHGS